MVRAERSAPQPITTQSAQNVTSGGSLDGLDLVDQRNLHLLGSSYNVTAPSVRAYVIDTGIATGHPDYGSCVEIYPAGVGITSTWLSGARTPSAAPPWRARTWRG